MKHLIRAGGVLAALIFVAFVLPRLVPTQTVEGLQSYGFYKVSNNSQEWSRVPGTYVAPAACSTCHNDKYSAWSESVHKTVSCESCHGAGQAHIEKGEKLVVNTSNQLCETCHTAVVGRPADFPQVDPATHGKQATCTTCHNPHDPAIPAIAHQVEGYNDCLLCHKTGGLKPYPQNHEGRTSDTCLSCHSDK